VVESYLRQSPLAALGLDGRAAVEQVPDAGVTMAEAPFRKMINLRGDKSDKTFLDAVLKATALNAPLQVGTTAGTTDSICMFCFGPDEWLLMAPKDHKGDIAGDLRAGLGKTHAAVTDVGEGGTVIVLEGQNARDVLAKGCALDFHPKSFTAGRCAQSLISRASVLIHQTSYDKAADACAYEVHVRWSFADYLFRWLEDAGMEYGVAIGADR